MPVRRGHRQSRRKALEFGQVFGVAVVLQQVYKILLVPYQALSLEAELRTEIRRFAAPHA